MANSLFRYYSETNDNAVKSVLSSLISAAAREINTPDIMNSLPEESFARLTGSDRGAKIDEIISVASAKGRELCMSVSEKDLGNGRKAEILRVNNIPGYVNCFSLYLTGYVLEGCYNGSFSAAGVVLMQDNPDTGNYRNRISEIKQIFENKIQIRVTDGFSAKIQDTVPAGKPVQETQTAFYRSTQTGRTCPGCGNTITDDSVFCDRCGMKLSENRVQRQQEFASAPAPDYQVSRQMPRQISGDNLPQQYSANNYPQHNSVPKSLEEDIANNKGISVLSYFGLFLLIPLLSRPDSQFARFHANQGLVCMLAALIMAFIPFVGWTLDLVVFVFQIIGIVHCINGEMKEVPLIGKIRIIK